MRKWIDPIAMILVAVAVAATLGCPAQEAARRADREERAPAERPAVPSTAHFATAAVIR